MSAKTPEVGRLETLERENARLRRAVEELSILNELATTIGAAREMEEVIQAITRRSMRAVGAAQGVLTLLGLNEVDANRTLVRTSLRSDEREVFRPNESLLGWMHIHKRPLLINDPHHDERFRGTRFAPAIRSILAVPMMLQSRLVGTLTLYNKKDADGFREDDQRLLSILAAQSAQVIENARLREEEKELTRLQEEYRLAFDIQTRLLPPEPPTVPGYDLAGTSHPAEAVGGDYFDYIPNEKGGYGLCVGDVSGKGLPAALLMANVQATLRSLTLTMGDALAEGIGGANRLLCRSIRKGSFVTLFYGLLDPATHHFRYVNAGHNRPLWMRPGQPPEELPSDGLVLGFLPDFKYTEHRLTLAPGDALVIYSDGITEATNEAGEQYEDHRLATLLARHPDAAAADLVAHILADVARHTGTAPQADDMTLLVFRRLS